MSPPHDASAAAESAEDDQVEKSTREESLAESGQSAEDGPQADGASGEPGRPGWSGRAVGPLSGLLPGGAVELNDAGERPAELTPAPQGHDEAAGYSEAPEPGLSATEDRWHAVLVRFVDDPRGSVEAARALLDEDIATHIALLARRKEAMHAAWQASREADTEALRVMLVSYRDLRRRLVDVLNARHHGAAP